MLWFKFLPKITILIYGTEKCVDTPHRTSPPLLRHWPQIYSFNTQGRTQPNTAGGAKKFRVGPNVCHLFSKFEM